MDLALGILDRKHVMFCYVMLCYVQSYIGLLWIRLDTPGLFIDHVHFPNLIKNNWITFIKQGIEFELIQIII